MLASSTSKYLLIQWNTIELLIYYRNNNDNIQITFYCSLLISNPALLPYYLHYSLICQVVVASHCNSNLVRYHCTTTLTNQTLIPTYITSLIEIIPSFVYLSIIMKHSFKDIYLFVTILYYNFIKFNSFSTNDCSNCLNINIVSLLNNFSPYRYF